MTAIQRFFRPGQYLFREGEPSHCMYLVKKGTVAVRKMKGSGYVEIARIYSNEVIGELSFFDRLPRSAAAIAMTEVETLEITFESLDKVYTNVPDYLKTIIASVADRLRKANDQIRRLQKNVVADDSGVDDAVNKAEQDLDAASVLASSADVDSLSLGDDPASAGGALGSTDDPEDPK